MHTDGRTLDEVPPTAPGGPPAARVVADVTGPGVETSATFAGRAARAVAKEGKGTKEVDVPLDAIHDLPDVAASPPGTTVGTLDLLKRPASRDAGPASSDGVPPRTGGGRRAPCAPPGQEQRVAELVARHGACLHRYVSRMLPDAGDVLACLHEVLVAAVTTSAPTPGDDAGTRTRLLRLAHRSAGATAPRAGVAAPAVARAGGVDLLLDLDACLRLLPRTQRAAWLLSEVEGLSAEEVATVLDVEPSAVAPLLAQARGSLAAAFSALR